MYNVVFLSPTADTLVRTEITYDLGDNRNASRELTQHVCDMSVRSQQSAVSTHLQECGPTGLPTSGPTGSSPAAHDHNVNIM